MNSPIPSPSPLNSEHFIVSELSLIRLLENTAQLPTDEECRQIVAQIHTREDCLQVTHAVRLKANEMCQSTDKAKQQLGILLLKELEKNGDPYAILAQAWIRWNNGPLKNHQHALTLIEKAIGQKWAEWPKFERARIALGEAFRLKGLLLLRGEKIKHNPNKALDCFKFAADKYLDGEAAWIAAEIHSRSASNSFANIAKPHAQASNWYMNRAEEQGFVPTQYISAEQVRS